MGKHSHFTVARILLSMMLMLTLAACRQSQQQATQSDASPVTIELHASPEPPTTGDTTLLISLTDKDGQPIQGARLEVRGDMTHAGMEPVTAIADASAGSEGQYSIPFRWTMSGDWIVTVNVTLANGESHKQTFDLSVESS